MPTRLEKNNYDVTERLDFLGTMVLRDPLKLIENLGTMVLVGEGGGRGWRGFSVGHALCREMPDYCTVTISSEVFLPSGLEKHIPARPQFYFLFIFFAIIFFVC